MGIPMNTKNFIDLVKKTGFNKTQLANELEINPRTVRRYCSPYDNWDAPKAIELAVRYLVLTRE